MRLYLNSNCFEVLIFDLDGTLYPREVYVSAYYDFTLQALIDLLRYGRDEAESELERNNISRNPRAAQSSVSSLMLKLGVPLEEWNDYRDKNLALASKITYNQSLERTVRSLRLLYELVIITNNTLSITESILSNLHLKSTDFSLIITSNSEMPVKPLSASFSHVANRFKTEPSKILSIGDRYEVDIEPLLALGGSGILVTGPEDIPLIAHEYLL